MSRPGTPTDNAYGESFIKTLKAEQLDGKAYRDLEDLALALPTLAPLSNSCTVPVVPAGLTNAVNAQRGGWRGRRGRHHLHRRWTFISPPAKLQTIHPAARLPNKK